MKPADIRALGHEEQLQKAIELRQELFNLRFQREIGQLDNLAKIKEIKRDIARVRTIIRENELGQDK
jgi:large subunit ribosomal protein L29